ncbi:hypothetical protein RBSWK_01502 [Rhodopirellula baltica SWK14]|uniref:Uncharacterized protein n=1 Tax=Rhodopirellula baltica SWK14 TaxID=993516 RepID=L7CKV1_RHOBT|nr:hypothetical protein RBSWK_01502 [Rhodopirellula baltica SWK14]
MEDIAKRGAYSTTRQRRLSNQMRNPLEIERRPTFILRLACLTGVFRE